MDGGKPVIASAQGQIKDIIKMEKMICLLNLMIPTAWQRPFWDWEAIRI
jgi:hypothetical protein